MRSSIEGRYPIPVISAFDKEIQNKTLQKKKGAGGFGLVATPQNRGFDFGFATLLGLSRLWQSIGFASFMFSPWRNDGTQPSLKLDRLEFYSSRTFTSAPLRILLCRNSRKKEHQANWLGVLFCNTLSKSIHTASFFEIDPCFKVSG